MNDYLKFGLITAVVCAFFPVLAGVVVGVLMFCAAWYVAYRMIGGT